MRFKDQAVSCQEPHTPRIPVTEYHPGQLSKTLNVKHWQILGFIVLKQISISLQSNLEYLHGKQ
jgi:hypothetical protein